MSTRSSFLGLSLSALALVSGLGFAPLPALAQEAEPAVDAAEDLSMGTEAGAAPAILTAETAQVGQGYLAANFDLWEQRCEKTADGKDPCQLFQLLKDAEGNAVSEFSMFPLPAGGQAAAGATVVVPLETLLTAALTIAIDSAPAKVYPFTFCAQIGCVARVGFTAEEVEQFKKGAKATITVVPAAAPETKVNVDISLKGFTAGYEAVLATLPK
ncbi:invasion associated locus B family protein [Tabrizicola sp.]|uniref:invasion associated locus B family protein n=1 Tax=Tabrizicola sp. TaxID=2005166 RepID=UPI003D2B0F12